MSITILICTHNRKKLLERTLASLNRAHRPGKHSISILIIANACTDDTVTFLKGYQTQSAEKNWLPLTCFEEANPGKSHALNRAIPELHSALVALVDDDHRVDKNYLTSTCKAAGIYPDASLFCGRILPDWNGSEPAWAHDTGPYRIYPLPIPRQEYGERPHLVGDTDPIPGGGNLILRGQIFDKIGGFSTKLGPQGHNLGGGEDTDFVLRALRNGERLFYIPDIKQYHYVDLTRFKLGYMIRKSFQRSRAAVQADQVHTQVPLYMWRKLAGYVFHTVFSLRWNKKRFFLLRVAAILGEIRGTQSVVSAKK